jgi:hypothetical protein
MFLRAGERNLRHRQAALKSQPGTIQFVFGLDLLHMQNSLEAAIDAERRQESHYARQEMGVSFP